MSIVATFTTSYLATFTVRPAPFMTGNTSVCGWIFEPNDNCPYNSDMSSTFISSFEADASKLLEILEKNDSSLLIVVSGTNDWDWNCYQNLPSL